MNLIYIYDDKIDKHWQIKYNLYMHNNYKSHNDYSTLKIPSQSLLILITHKYIILSVYLYGIPVPINFN